MTTKIKAFIVGGLILGFLGISIFSMWVSANNKEISLKNHIEAQQKVCESYYDKLWKVLKSKAQVADQYKDTFKEVYPALIEGRYGDEKGGALMKLIVESNPTFDISLYKDLTSSIDAERSGFFMENKKLIDLDREHKVLRQTFPASWFIGSRPDVKITLVTSEKTAETFRTGQENDIDLFKK